MFNRSPGEPPPVPRTIAGPAIKAPAATPHDFMN
jgi:hypothetical protein